MISVRRATPTDADNIFAAEKAYMDMPWSMSQICDEISSPRAVFLVAECDGDFAGYVSGASILDECEFGNIAVTENFRRRGVARELMHGLFSELSTADIKTVFLEVREDNAAAIRLYESFGFAAVRTRYAYYNGKNAIVMKKYLG